MNNNQQSLAFLKNEAALKRVKDVHNQRLEAISVDYNNAMQILDREARQLALERLYDEANGYTARVCQDLARSERDYNRSKLPIKSLKNLSRDMADSFYTDNLEQMKNELVNARNFSCHPPYYPPSTFNHIFANGDDVLCLVNNALDKIHSIKTNSICDDLILLREIREQQKALEKRSIEFLEKLEVDSNISSNF